MAVQKYTNVYVYTQIDVRLLKRQETSNFESMNFRIDSRNSGYSAVQVILSTACQSITLIFMNRLILKSTEIYDCMRLYTSI